MNTKIDNKVEINFTLNGVSTSRKISSSAILLDVIRDDIALKGTKAGCHEGECGACSVLVNGNAVNSCLYFAVNIDGKDLVTIEGLATNHEELDPVQDALIENGAVQCGFCTSGMAISLKSLKTKCDNSGKTPTRSEVERGIEGNLCRCTGYTKIVDAGEALFK
ncbi:MAG: (2Fe-2S)-binding protein [Proteobacteria bacterium]|nr:(2Fe-2S)-binding protein [Pseudomonadota bacterium]